MKNRVFIALGFYFLLAAPVDAQQGAQQFEKFNLQGFTDAGVRAWDVRGETAHVEGDVVHIQSVTANHYGERPVNMTADHGRLNKTSGDVHLENNVVIIAKETGGQLTTDYLEWDRKNDLVSTRAPVVIHDPQQGMRANGIGLEAHPDQQVAKMLNDVSVTIEPKDGQSGKITITCDGPMELDQKNHKAVFHDNVVAVETDRTVKADLMEVFFDPVTNEILEAVSTGNVRILQGPNTTYSEKAVYNGKDGTLKLIGKPRLILETQEKPSAPDP